ncbi:hypothetical protein L6164_007108 [Bauhinia variegata]|uniref:Uncharacterized protein n=1 Tax=Bauhinia variegata TaxID=167791 RepID=A0ACB9PWH4_BAUVA|nr:hypothetical protein L6164_007108 [Bauhinia variegata]
MGSKGGWFSAVKKVLSPESKKDKKNQKSKKKWFGKHKDSNQVLSKEEAPVPVSVAPPFPPIEHINLANAGNEQTKHAYSVALATAAAAKAAVAAAQAAAEVVRLTGIPLVPGKSKVEIAAIKIQTAFRGYLARRALRALKGLVRLKTLIKGQSVKRQSTTTLQCMQTLARLQSQIRERRIRMSEENQVLQLQLLQKHEKELEKLQASLVGEEWDDTFQSKEQIEARQANRQEAAIRRERALAYAYSHQQTWRNSSKSVTPTFMDPSNPHWGWSWIERWMATRPWESPNDHASSVKSAAASYPLSVGEITQLYAARDRSHDYKPSPARQKSSQPLSRQSPSTLASDDSRSLFSVQSERYSRRYSLAGSSSMRDDESLASSPAIPSYMAPTKATMVRSKTQSPLGVKNVKPGKALDSSAKRRLSFSASPRRPVTAKNVSKLSQDKVTNGRRL